MFNVAGQPTPLRDPRLAKASEVTIKPQPTEDPSFRPVTRLGRKFTKVAAAKPLYTYPSKSNPPDEAKVPSLSSTVESSPSSSQPPSPSMMDIDEPEVKDVSTGDDSPNTSTESKVKPHLWLPAVERSDKPQLWTPPSNLADSPHIAVRPLTGSKPAHLRQTGLLTPPSKENTRLQSRVSTARRSSSSYAGSIHVLSLKTTTFGAPPRVGNPDYPLTQSPVGERLSLPHIPSSGDLPLELTVGLESVQTQKASHERREQLWARAMEDGLPFLGRSSPPPPKREIFPNEFQRFQEDDDGRIEAFPRVAIKHEYKKRGHSPGPFSDALTRSPGFEAPNPFNSLYTPGSNPSPVPSFASMNDRQPAPSATRHITFDTDVKTEDGFIPRRPSTLSFGEGVEPKLKLGIGRHHQRNRSFDPEFSDVLTDEFCDAVFQYLSFPYDCIARQYDSELSEITGYSLEVVRNNRWNALRRYLEIFAMNS